MDDSFLTCNRPTLLLMEMHFRWNRPYYYKPFFITLQKSKTEKLTTPKQINNRLQSLPFRFQLKQCFNRIKSSISSSRSPARSTPFLPIPGPLPNHVTPARVVTCSPNLVKTTQNNNKRAAERLLKLEHDDHCCATTRWTAVVRCEWSAPVTCCTKFSHVASASHAGWPGARSGVLTRISMRISDRIEITDKTVAGVGRIGAGSWSHAATRGQHYLVTWGRDLDFLRVI